jgi:hypothetical protein
MDLSVVVASHLNPQGLYLTVFSVLSQLIKTQLSWEIIIAADGGDPSKWEKISGIRCLRIRTGSPQGTRDAGIRAAQAATVLVIEDHVVISDITTFLEEYRAINMPREGRAVMLFPARLFEGPEMFHVYGTETDFEGNLWFKRTLYSPKSGIPYRVPQFGNSCFIINRDWYVQSGGYTDLLTGWGGEEPFLCLKAWMLGQECWQTPHVWHAHYLSDHGAGAAMASEDFHKNFYIVKFVIQGTMPMFPPTSAMWQERGKIMAGPFQGDLNKLREYFRREGIA